MNEIFSQYFLTIFFSFKSISKLSSTQSPNNGLKLALNKSKILLLFLLIILV